MSETDAIQTKEATQGPPSQEHSNVELKARRRARCYKAACFYFAWSQSAILHKYAIIHSAGADQTRWHELVAPINARISDWIMLFLAPSLRPSTTGPPGLDSTAFFVVAHFTCFLYAHWYYNWNKHSDRFQLPTVAVAALVGLVSALSLNLGALISVSVVTPKAALAGLLLSDILHLLLYGPWRAEEKNEKVGDVEDGLLNARQDQQLRDQEKLPVVEPSKETDSG